MNADFPQSGHLFYSHEKAAKPTSIVPSSVSFRITHCLCVFLLMIWTQGVWGQDKLIGLTSKGGTLGGGTAFSITTAGASFTVSTNFVAGGKYPEADLVKGPDGNFYGMTPSGGTLNQGTIFKMDASGTITILKSLDGTTTGAEPHGSLVLGSDGDFYGTTSSGGANGYGTIFRFELTGTLTVIKNLQLNTTGSSPYGSLLLGSDGYFYGMTRVGGTNNDGTIFKINATGTSFSVIKHLSNTTTGRWPEGNLIQGSDGLFYGMVTSGGAKGYGTIFKINATGTTFQVLKHLDYYTYGATPHGSLVEGASGVFYGMTSTGGAGNGIIFKITSGGTFTMIKNLSYSTTGINPRGSLIKGSDGYFYGMTNSGGTASYGTVFKMNATGSTFTILKNMDDINTGSYPYGSLVQGASGIFYGMAWTGGTNHLGTIFKVTSASAFTVLARFPASDKGVYPNGALLQASNGYFYGMSEQGGTSNYGTLYRLCPNGSFTKLRDLDYTKYGANPQGSLMQASDGNLYGMTIYGGSGSYGVIFRMTLSGTVTVLKNLVSSTTGGYPAGSLIQGSDGYLYGLTSVGGTNNCGTIFKINTAGTTFTVLKHLDNTSGKNPYGSLVQGSDGYFYGMTSNGGANNQGTIFKINATGTSFTVIKNLSNATGTNPKGGLIKALDGLFYGMTYQGGSGGYGTIFKINTTGSTFGVLKNLDYTTTGGWPEGSLVQGSDGTLYGMTSTGGANKAGTIFKITTGGSLTILRPLKASTDGGTPLGSLVIQKAAATPKANAQSVSTLEDSAKVITLTGSGGTPLTYTITTVPKNGTISGSGASRTYKPKANYYGKDSFYFTASWGCQSSAAAKVLITITKVNDAPVLVSIGNKTVVKGKTLTFTAAATDVDAGQTKTFSLIGAPSGAAIGASSGAFSWTPTAIGSYTFKVRVTDNGSPALYDEEQITVTVTTSTLTTIRKADINPMAGEGTLRVQVWPNPSANEFTLSINSAGTEGIRIKVLDAVGRVVETIDNRTASQRVYVGRNFMPGVYYAQVVQGREQVTVQLVKQSH